MKAWKEDTRVANGTGEGCEDVADMVPCAERENTVPPLG